MAAVGRGRIVEAAGETGDRTPTHYRPRDITIYPAPFSVMMMTKSRTRVVIRKQYSLRKQFKIVKSKTLIKRVSP
jgi:hypothetical protein